MRPHRRVLIALLALTVAMVAACTSGAQPPQDPHDGSTGAPATSPAPPGPAGSGAATPGTAAPSATASNPAERNAAEPLVSALAVHGPADLSPNTVVIDAASVMAISGDGAEFTLVTDQTIEPGTVFVVPGIAARRATTVTPLPTETAVTERAALLVQTVQATIDEIFSDLDVTFDGEPDPAAMTFVELPVDAAALAALGEYEVGHALRGSPRPHAVIPAAPPLAAPPLAAPRLAPPQPGPQPCTGTSVEVGSPTVKAGPYEVSATGAATPSCRSIAFSIGASRQDTAKISATLAGSATVGAIRGRVTNRAGQNSSLAVDLDASLAFSMSAATERATIDKAKITWDLIKIDIPIVLGGVPTVVRVGVPLTIEARFSGGADVVNGTLLTLTCRGTVTIAADSDTPKDTCHLQPIDVQQIMSVAPSGVVIAAGLKVGFGLGTAVKGKAVVFAGATATLAGAVGVTYSGGTGIPVTECTRLDRSVSLNFGGQAEVLGMTLSTSKPVWTKSDTDQEGQRCRPLN